MSKFSAKKSSLRLLSCILAFCMCITMFANTVGFFALAETAETVTVWDGTDNYTSLDDVLTDLGAADSDGYYHIKTANQLHAVIRYNGGGNSYKLDNNLYLNADYADYANWTSTNAPANNWNFTSSNKGAPVYGFSGTIDGCGYTVYGMYSNGNNFYAGLIGTLSDTTVIKNLNMSNLYVKAANYSGAIIGGLWYGTAAANMTVTFEGCTVKNAVFGGVWNNGSVGAFIGNTCRTTNIKNSAVYDVVFHSSGKAGDVNAYGTIGSFVGGTFAGMQAVADPLVFYADQAKRINISDSYSVNAKLSNNDSNVYPCGIYKAPDGGTTWSYAFTANNVYTDATVIPSSPTVAVHLLVSADGNTAVDPEDENFPIHTITADDIIGDGAKTAMSLLNWNYWQTVANDYPVYREIEIWDGKDNYTSLDAVLSELTLDSDGYYHIETANQLHAVIRLGGGANKYKLDNDLYLNSDWENYKSWTNNNPAPNDWALSGSGYSFSGTIDGCGYTIYGYYNNASAGNKNYVGLIPVVNFTKDANQSVTLKNLNMRYCSQNGNTASGFFIGATHYASSGTVIIEGCSVRNGFLNLLWDDNLAGAFVGRVAGNTPVTIRNCAVGDIVFDANGNGTGYSGYSTYGSFVGATYTSPNTDYTFHAGQAKTVKIYDSYAYNCMNAKTNEPVYICGIFRENAANNKYSYCVTANNVYTDATEIPVNNDGTVKLLISADGATEVKPTDEDFPIYTITADSIIGVGAKTAMPKLDWNAWQTVANDYPVYKEIKIWDGNDNYQNLDAVLAELTVDKDNIYHITTANQLHAVIRLGGGGKYYKLDNNLYLNANWEDYASWTNNSTDLNDWALSGTTYSFSGTIDGDNHAIYGYFNNAAAGNKNYVGLIPVVNWNSGETQNVTIKNLDMLYCNQNGSTASGFFIGATHWQGKGAVNIENCTVKNGYLDLIWNGNLAGTFVGRAAGNTPVTISNCAAENITFDFQGDGTSVYGYSTIGSFVGATNANLDATYAFSTGQAKAVKIYNSYAFDCVNKATNKLVYICGLFRDGKDSATGLDKYSYCLTAKNVYTDATEVPTNLDGSVTLLVSEDGLTENNTVAVPTADNYAGLFESGAWYMGKFGDNTPVLKSRTADFAYLDITGEGIEDKYSATDMVYLRKHLLGVDEYAYILGNVNCDEAVNIIDLVKIKKILSGK